jgi:hypothetical protein
MAESRTSEDSKRARVESCPDSAEDDQGGTPGDTIVVDAPVGNSATLPSPCRSSSGDSQRDPLDLAQSAHAQLINEAQAAVTALRSIEAHVQAVPLPFSPDTPVVDPQNGPVHAVSDSRTVAADRVERPSRFISVEDLLTSAANPPLHQAVSTHAPCTGQIPRPPSDTTTELQHDPGQTSSLEPGVARRPGRPHS